MRSPSIWPGPECLKSVPDIGLVGSSKAAAVARARRIEELSRTLGPFGAVGQLAREQAQGRRVLTRSLGIAMALEAARARMGRFVAWLRDEGLCGTASLASIHISPEAATAEAIEAGCRWPFSRTGHAWDDAWLVEARGACDFGWMAHRLFRSAAWASLPWQRDEVSRG
jgi:hypothetical protein